MAKKHVFFWRQSKFYWAALEQMLFFCKNVEHLFFERIFCGRRDPASSLQQIRERARESYAAFSQISIHVILNQYSILIILFSYPVKYILKRNSSRYFGTDSTASMLVTLTVNTKENKWIRPWTRRRTSEFKHEWERWKPSSPRCPLRHEGCRQASWFLVRRSWPLVPPCRSLCSVMLRWRSQERSSTMLCKNFCRISWFRYVA